jgi:predicted NAD/FAD-dependent oxidoreductase
MARVVVVGAGLSGVVCARELTAHGHDVVVRDTGRRPGGRMALRRHDDRVVDIGASYFTVRDAAFEAVVDDWELRCLARPWTATFTAWTPEGREPKPGPMRWAAPAGLRSLVEDLAARLDVRSADPVQRVEVGDAGPEVDGEPADAVVLAMPDPQARRLLTPGTAAHDALDDPYEPAIALTAGWDARSWPDEDGIFVGGHPDLAWVADDGLRRGDRAPVLVAHSTADRARRHLEDPPSAAEPMLAALRDVVDVPTADPRLVHVQRWTFARPAEGHAAAFHLDDDLVGACGDAWGETSSVETAYRSGRALGLALVERLA